MPPKYVRSRRRGIVSLGHFCFILFQQLNLFPLHCFLVGNHPLATSLPSNYKKKKKRRARRRQHLNQSVVMFWDLLTIQRASPLKSKQISKVAHPCKASPLLYQVINSHCLLKFPLCLAVAGHKVECSRRANSMDTAWASLTAETGMPGLKGAEVLT